MSNSYAIRLLCFIAVFAAQQAYAQLPEPTGSYCVSKSKIQAIDKSRLERMTEEPNDFRRLALDIWRPAECKGDFSRYIHPEVLAAFKESREIDESHGLSFIAKMKTHTRMTSNFAQETIPAPVILFSHGSDMPIDLYTTFYESLASHGYAVVAISHTHYPAAAEFPYGEIVLKDNYLLNQQFSEEAGKAFEKFLEFVKSDASPDGKLIEAKRFFADFPTTENTIGLAHDISFVIDTLTAINGTEGGLFYNKLDLENIGGFGHSFGGAAMGQALLLESRLKGAINLDGWQTGAVAGETFDRPFLYVRGGYEKPDALNEVIYVNAGEHFTRVKVEGAQHSNFSDLPLFSGSDNIFNIGELDPQKNVDILNDVILGFFDQTLRSDNARWSLLDEKHPELVFEIGR